MAKHSEIGFITEDDRYLFGMGRHYEIYKKLGAHPYSDGTSSGYYFAVWAPHAKKVSVVGEFNGWDTSANPMQPLATSGIWEAYVPDAAPLQLYKFAIKTSQGDVIYKADPYARSSEFRPGTASVTADEPWNFKWGDKAWLNKRAKHDPRRVPISIYECHLGSWKKCDNPEKDGFLNYKDLAHELGDYLTDMGYTHIELMGIAEHPFDGSWGYQVTGYYAPTSRYGTPSEFSYFVNYMHKKGIGVILDWVPAHFPKDDFGLSLFDGVPLYEYPDPRMGEHPDWGTKIFNYGNNEVKNFLIANALYWLNEYHIDGLRVDAVASMLYLDYGRRDGEWVPNKYGDNKNLDAIEFFKHLNSIIAGRGDGSMIIAEESTAWPLVTHSPEDGGLGFTFKWNMGWMHDFLEYMKLDPYFRKGAHSNLTFAMTYATSENYILVLSHDEVVHLKCSMINKMPGIYEDKFYNLKCAYAFMIGHPGKKLLFMGQDFAQWHEWDEKVSLDWHLLNEPLNAELHDFYKSLLHIYKSYSCLYELDDNWDGFQWVNANDGDRSIYSWIRYNSKKKKSLLFVVNFTPMERSDYMVGVPKLGKYKLVLDEKVGSYELAGKSPVVYKASKGECDGLPFRVVHSLSAYGVLVFEF